MTLGEFVEPWLAGLVNQGREPTTLKGYRGCVERYVMPVLGSVPLQDLRATDLGSLYVSLLGRLSMTSVHHVHAVVNKLLHDAERKGRVQRNVARLANAPSLTTARGRGPEMTVWTPAELSSFLAFIEGNRNDALFRLMAMTGLRRGEVVGLRWSDVQLDRHRPPWRHRRVRAAR